MARKQVLQVQCDRCTRVETLDPDKVKPGRPENVPIFSLEFDGLKGSFHDLCGPCYRAVQSHLLMACKKIDGLSPDRAVKVEGVDAAKEVQVIEAELDAKKKAPKAPSPTAHNGR